MVYRISISEVTMKRLKEYASAKGLYFKMGRGKKAGYESTVESILSHLLLMQGF
jgi:hypothetical protein